MSSDAGARSLDQTPEFEDAIRAAAEYHGILPDLVRKDYWVTRVLQSIAQDPSHDGRVLFKGGTSLSKGWRLIDRFSEDIDLLLTGPDHGPVPEAKKDRERQFRALRVCVEAATPMRLPDQKLLEREEWNFHYFRSDFHCNLRYPIPGRQSTRAGSSNNWLLIEAGFRGGALPHARRDLTSLLAEFIRTQPNVLDPVQYAADLSPFQMDLLSPERTFVEKLLALHELMSQGDDGARQVRTRHYHDVVQLYAHSSEVRKCIASDEIGPLIREAIAVSNKYWGAQLDPDTLDLCASPALQPTKSQARILRASYASERALYYRDPLQFDDILAIVDEIRASL